MERARTVNELYADRDLYTSQDMFSPPAERLSRVIRFELTTGCDWGKCTYCGGFDGVPFREKSLEEYKGHVDNVMGRMSKTLRNGLTRIFIGGGNALEVETNKLIEAIKHTGNVFANQTYRSPRRISIYGRTDSIRRKGAWGLNRLFLENDSLGFGLDLVYWGVESGSSEVLEYVNKGVSKEDIIAAAREIGRSPVKTSVMIMPGLGGEKFYDSHVKDTVEVLDEIRPKFLTFMGINPDLSSSYARRMLREQEEGKNRPLTDKELVEQMIEIINRMPAFRTKVGCFGCDIDRVGYNPLILLILNTLRISQI
jgi:radical SAM superfamily enzyme YgiQ (UPF0313 family)